MAPQPHTFKQPVRNTTVLKSTAENFGTLPGMLQCASTKRTLPPAAPPINFNQSETPGPGLPSSFISMVMFHQVHYPFCRDLWEQTIHASPRTLFVYPGRKIVQDLRADRARLPEKGEKAVEFQPLPIGGLSNRLLKYGRVDGRGAWDVKKCMKCQKRDLLEIPVVRWNGSEGIGGPSWVRPGSKCHVFELCRFREVNRT